MTQEIGQYLERYPAEIVQLFTEIREIACSLDGITVTETLWAKLPSYYCGEKFVRIIPFKDHINIEAAGLSRNAEQLSAYRFTPKGMLQVKAGQKPDSAILKKAFTETLR